MPHSSGGGHSGGHFSGGHGGSFGGGRGSSNSFQCSRRHFAGAKLYRYGRRHNRYIWCRSGSDSGVDVALNIIKSIVYFCCCVFIISLMLGSELKGMRITSNGLVPKKVHSKYDVTPEIFDVHCFVQEDEEALRKTMDEFYDKTGIAVRLLMIKSSDRNDLLDAPYTTYVPKPALESYAYKKYFTYFMDETGWLIVYCVDAKDPSSWEFHGMQGNDTDGVLSYNLTLEFNKELTAYLDRGEPVGTAFNMALTSLKDKTMTRNTVKMKAIREALPACIFIASVCILALFCTIRPLVIEFMNKELVTDADEIAQAIAEKKHFWADDDDYPRSRNNY